MLVCVVSVENSRSSAAQQPAVHAIPTQSSFRGTTDLKTAQHSVTTSMSSAGSNATSEQHQFLIQLIINNN